MKLQKFKVTDFRSVIDSGWIDVDDVTTLVGINESGKTNILLALWKLNPVRDGKIDLIHDLPVTKLAELRNELDKTCFIEAEFSLEESAEIFSDKFGVDFQSDDRIIFKRFYDEHFEYNFVTLEQNKAVLALLEPAEDENEVHYTDEALMQVLLQQLPSFVYYSNYGNLASEVYLPHAVKWLKGETVTGFPMNEDQIRTLKVLFEYVKLKPDEILRLGEDAKDIAQRRHNQVTENDISEADRNKEQRSLLLQSASAKLTRDFREWWKQGEYTFSLEADGDYFRIWVSDEKRPASVALELRSTGLQWFLSFFLVFLVECQGENKDAILLLDEAGLTLHPMAQKDLALFLISLQRIIPLLTRPILHLSWIRIILIDAVWCIQTNWETQKFLRIYAKVQEMLAQNLSTQFTQH